MKYRFSINVDEVARQVGKDVVAIRERVTGEVQRLSISTHAFVVAKANAELDGYIRKIFLGKNNENVRWEQVADRIWAVTIDESVAWIEEGKPSVFMRWLLDNNPKAKTAKDGSRYARIPLTHARLAGSSANRQNNPKAAYESMVKNAMKASGIALKKIERNEDGSPKLGILHRLDVQPPGSQSQFPGMFSMPRPADVAKKVGLPPHGGIFHLKGAVVTQRMDSKNKPIREVITFRTISSKHEAEGNRWMSKAIQPFGALEAATKYAREEWERIVEAIKRDYR